MLVPVPPSDPFAHATLFRWPGWSTALAAQATMGASLPTAQGSSSEAELAPCAPFVGSVTLPTRRRGVKTDILLWEEKKKGKKGVEEGGNDWTAVDTVSVCA